VDERTYQPLLDKLYTGRGYQIKRINGEANRAYDVELIKPEEEKVFKVEEKGLVKTDALAFEIVQDMKMLADLTSIDGGYKIPKNCPGNQFTTKAPIQIWICGTLASYTVYQVTTKELHDFYKKPEIFKRYPIKPIPQGFGLTICALIPWYVLEREKIAKKIYETPKVFEPKPIKKAA
jgi:hypothetical protein